VPSLLDPWMVGTLSLKNRIVVSSMCQYQADDTGHATDWHTVHYGSLALGGAALLMVEASAVEARGRISTRDLGLYADSHVEPLRKIVEFAHAQGTKVGIQLAHAGRKADVPSDIVAPSAIAFSDHYKMPIALSEADIHEVCEAFAAATVRAVAAGFDFLEIHGAHGYLIHQYLSPYSNHRSDGYGGDLGARMRFADEVIKAVKATAGHTPVGIRISASDYHPEGYDGAEAVLFSDHFAQAGIAVIDVSSGGNTLVPPHVFPGYQVSFAAAIKQRVAIPVIAVGMLDDPLLADFVVQSGQADAVAVARGFLRNPHWGLHAAVALGHKADPPESYRRGYL